MRISVRQIVVAGVLGAVAILLQATGIGFIPSPSGISATTMHIPAIIGGILEGPVVGGLIGLIFGLYSWLFATGAEIFFKDPLVSILPRIFIGSTAFYAYQGLKRATGNEILAMASGAVVGTLTNTVLVLGMIVLRGYFPLAAVLPVGAINGSVEIVVAALITVAVVAAWKRVELRRKPVI